MQNRPYGMPDACLVRRRIVLELLCCHGRVRLLFCARLNESLSVRQGLEAFGLDALDDLGDLAEASEIRTCNAPRQCRDGRNVNFTHQLSHRRDHAVLAHLYGVWISRMDKTGDETGGIWVASVASH